MRNHRQTTTGDLLVRQLIREYLSDWDQYSQIPGVSKEKNYFRTSSGKSSNIFGGGSLTDKRKKSWFQRLREKATSTSKSPTGRNPMAPGAVATALRFVAPFLGLPGRVLLTIASAWGLTNLYTSLTGDESEKADAIETANSTIATAGDKILTLIESSSDSLLDLKGWPVEGDDAQKNLDKLKEEMLSQAERLNTSFSNNQMSDPASDLGVTLTYPQVDGILPGDVKSSINSIALIGLVSKTLIDVNNAIGMLKNKFPDDSNIESFGDEYINLFLDKITDPEAREVIKQSEILAN